MSVRPTAFFADGTAEVWHDEAAHGGVVHLDALPFQRHMDGTPSYDHIELACPVPGCGSISWHPISGGAAPERVQELFLRKLRRHPGPIPGLPVSNRRSFNAVKNYVKTRADALDGPGRFRHDDKQGEDDFD